MLWAMCSLFPLAPHICYPRLQSAGQTPTEPLPRGVQHHELLPNHNGAYFFSPPPPQRRLRPPKVSFDCYHEDNVCLPPFQYIHLTPLLSPTSVLDLVVVKKGDNEIPGLTDTTAPRRLGPKRVGKIRKLFALSKEDDVRQYVVHRPLPEKEGRKPKSKAPKIQRLVTPGRCCCLCQAPRPEAEGEATGDPFQATIEQPNLYFFRLIYYCDFEVFIYQITSLILFKMGVVYIFEYQQYCSPTVMQLLLTEQLREFLLANSDYLVKDPSTTHIEYADLKRVWKQNTPDISFYSLLRGTELTWKTLYPKQKEKTPEEMEKYQNKLRKLEYSQLTKNMEKKDDGFFGGSHKREISTVANCLVTVLGMFIAFYAMTSSIEDHVTMTTLRRNLKNTVNNYSDGYILKITGGNDLQGFCMMQGVLCNIRVRLLFKDGMPNYTMKRKGVRKRKSVRGCIVDSQLSVLDLVVVKKGDNEIPGLTDTTAPRRLGPKRVGKIRKLFALSKEDDVRQYVVHRPLPEKEGRKPKSKAPKIQRLVTPGRCCCLCQAPCPEAEGEATGYPIQATIEQPNLYFFRLIYYCDFEVFIYQITSLILFKMVPDFKSTALRLPSSNCRDLRCCLYLRREFLLANSDYLVKDPSTTHIEYADLKRVWKQNTPDISFYSLLRGTELTWKTLYPKQKEKTPEEMEKYQNKLRKLEYSQLTKNMEKKDDGFFGGSHKREISTVANCLVTVLGMFIAFYAMTSSIEDHVTMTTLRRNLKNTVNNYSDVQCKVREATCNEPWGPATTLMTEISDATYAVVEFAEIMSVLWKRLNDHGKNWRHVYKALLVMDFIIKRGSERVAQQCKEQIYFLLTLQDFRFIDKDGKDVGGSVMYYITFTCTLNRFTSGRASSSTQQQHLHTSPSQQPGPSEPRLSDAMEKARPSDRDEEALQIELALAISKEEADKENFLSRKQQDDADIRATLERSRTEAQIEQPTLLSLSRQAPPPPPPPTYKDALDPWGMPVQDPPTNDPWGGAPSSWQPQPEPVYTQPAPFTQPSLLDTSLDNVIAGGHPHLSSPPPPGHELMLSDPWMNGNTGNVNSGGLLQPSNSNMTGGGQMDLLATGMHDFDPFSPQGGRRG
eukprot:sb/3461357/